MGGDGRPVPGGSNPHQPHRPIAKRKPGDAAVAGEARGYDECLQVAGGAAVLQQEVGLAGLAHGAALSVLKNRWNLTVMAGLVSEAIRIMGRAAQRCLPIVMAGGV